MADSSRLTGRIEIDVDDSAMLAVLHFTPDENGQSYDLQDIFRLINEKNITYGMDRKQVESRLEPVFADPAEANITIAEGEAPVSAVSGEYLWESLVIPDEHKDDVARMLKNAAPPQIFKTEITKIRKERTVKKKGLLPFGKEKEETVVETLKQENKIRVEIQPDVIEAGWADKGVKLAEFKSGIDGVPGKDVYGKPVQPSGADDEFYTGKGVELKGNAIVAVEEGILRRGWNWVEILPFRSHDWTLELSKDKNTCLLNFNPGGTESTPPDAEEILNRAKMLGATDETLVTAERVRQIINTAVETGRVLENAVISTDDDGSFEIKISEDKLKAELLMHKSRGNGAPLVLKEVGSAIKKSGLKSLDLKKIQELILEFYKGPDVDTAVPLCEGTPPELGEAGALVYDLAFLKEGPAEEIRKRIADLPAEYLEQIDSAEEYPLAEAAAFAVVSENQQIAEIPENTAKKGVDVFGAEISGAAGGISALKTLKNVAIKDGKIVALQAGLLERFDAEDETAYRVRPHADAELKVNVSSDRMTATLSAEPAIGTGTPPSLEEANRLIAEAGIVNGLTAESVRSAVEKCRSGEAVSGALIAMGKSPKNAGEMKLKFMVEIAGDRAVSINDKGQADYRKQNRISSVKEGEIIAEIQVIEGNSEDGFDVLGNSLAAKQLTPLNLEVGANIREEKDEKGDTFLIAEKAGRLIYEKNRLEVHENLFIKGDVDFSTGNIKFSGDVNVKGNVRSGFFVMAGGNINIGMNSEMSLLSSDKSIAVAQGIKGGGKAILRSKESIQLSFAERATLLAVNDITSKNAIFSCKVKCNGRLRLISEKGYLVGGVIQAREGVDAQNIGSISGSRTRVSFGQDYLIADRIETEEKEIEKIKNRLIKIDPEMRQAEKALESKKLAVLRAEKIKLMKIMEKRSMRVFALKERFEQHYTGEVTIRGEVFPGVVFESHGRTLEITKSEKAVRIEFNQETGILEKVPIEKKEK